MFKHILVSFTHMLRAYVKGNLTSENVGQSPLLAFGCAREHVLCADDRVPMELSWCQSAFLGGLGRHHGRYKPWHGQEPHGSEIPRSLVHPDLLKVWDELAAIIRKKDENGQVEWRIGNYEAFMMAKAEDGHTCYMGGVYSKREDC